MQLSDSPAKLVLPFADAGAKNTIPVASQIGITAGAASLTDGFPPLTRTPIAAGGVPPSGLDMNGVLFELSAVIRWANAGGGYAYDSAFATDSNVGGYPKGARVMRLDGLGYWFNTAENNQTDPEGAGAVAAGWVPDFTTGVTAVAMTSSSVTLTAEQYGKPVIVISGLLTANLNLIFPNIAARWIVINNTTGAFSITCKTAAGTGIVVASALEIVGDATNIYAANDGPGVLSLNVASASGTADALTATFSPPPRSWAAIAGVPFWVRAASANATTTPTFATNGLTAKTIVKGNDLPLVVGDIAGAGHWLQIQYDAALDKAVLLNPARGVVLVPVSSIQGASKNLQVSTTGLSANVTVGADEIVVETSANVYQTLRSVSLTVAGTSVGANGIDTGVLAVSTWYSVWVIWNGTTTAGLMSLSATSPTLPSGYTYKARVGWIRTDSTGNKYPLPLKQNGRSVRYVVGPSNMISLPNMASGISGSPTVATFSAISVSNFVPPTASQIYINSTFQGAGQFAIIAPNNTYGVANSATNPCPVSYAGAASPNQHVQGQSTGLLLESSNIYWASSCTGVSIVACYGWEDNL